jgi:L-aminopeptidase/D-esterase-like protein
MTLHQAGSGKDKADGSCMNVVATDASLDARNLKRLAARAWLGIGRTGGSTSNGSGDYAIALSTAPQVRIHANDKALTWNTEVVTNDAMSPLFLAAIEAMEEAVYPLQALQQTLWTWPAPSLGCRPESSTVGFCSIPLS